MAKARSVSGSLKHADAGQTKGKGAKMPGNQMDISEEVRVGELGGNEVKESQSSRENTKRLSGDRSTRIGPEEALDE